MEYINNLSDLMRVHIAAGDRLALAGEFTSAIQEYKEAREINETLLMKQEEMCYLHTAVELDEKVGDCYVSLNTQQSLEDGKYEYFMAMILVLWAKDARNADMDITKARLDYKSGMCDFRNGLYQQAEKSFLEAFDIYRKLVTADSNRFYEMYASTARSLSKIYFAWGDDVAGAKFKAISMGENTRETV